jgi:hypothetical protein
VSAPTEDGDSYLTYVVAANLVLFLGYLLRFCMVSADWRDAVYACSPRVAACGVPTGEIRAVEVLSGAARLHKRNFNPYKSNRTIMYLLSAYLLGV